MSTLPDQEIVECIKFTYPILMRAIRNYEQPMKFQKQKELCLLTVGEDVENAEDMSLWGLGLSQAKMKPLFLHAATMIFINVKYPHLRAPNSWVHPFMAANLIEDLVQIAIDVMKSDADVAKLLECADKMFLGNNCIIDPETYETVKTSPGLQKDV